MTIKTLDELKVDFATDQSLTADKFSNLFDSVILQKTTEQHEAVLIEASSISVVDAEKKLILRPDGIDFTDPSASPTSPTIPIQYDYENSKIDFNVAVHTNDLTVKELKTFRVNSDNTEKPLLIVESNHVAINAELTGTSATFGADDSEDIALSVKGKSQLQGEITITGNAELQGGTTITGSAALQGETTITGNAKLLGETITLGDSAHNSAHSSVHINNFCTIDDEKIVLSDNKKVSNEEASRKSEFSANYLHINKVECEDSNALYVSGTSTLDGPTQTQTLSILGQNDCLEDVCFEVTGHSLLRGCLTIGEENAASLNLRVNGNSELKNDLTVEGSSTLKGRFRVQDSSQCGAFLNYQNRTLHLGQDHASTEANLHLKVDGQADIQ